MRRVCLILLALAATVALAGADVRPFAPGERKLVCDKHAADGEGRVKIKPNTLFRVRINGVDPKAAILWRVYPFVAVDKATTPKDLLEFVAPPGVYRVECLVITQGADGALSVDEQAMDVEFERPCEKVPPAPVEPKPDPKKPDPKKPDPKPKADAWNALGRIQFGNAGCTATIVYPRRADGKWDVLTANHCIEHVGVGAKGSMQLRGKSERIAVRVVTRDARSDCAWLVTEDATLADLPYAHLAESNAPAGTKIWHGGYGIDVPGNREEGSVTTAADSNGQTEMVLSVSSGDSGGGIFRADVDEIISTVCCTTNRGARARVWGANVESIRRIRPKAAADDHGEGWAPIDIPRRAGVGDWSPVPIPLRASDALAFNLISWIAPMPREVRP